MRELSRLVNALPCMVWTALPDGNIDFLNRRWYEYTRISVEEACGAGWQTAIHPEDLPQLLKRWRSMVASGEPAEMEGRLRRFDGEYRWFLFRIGPLADSSGWCGISTDIDDRKRAEEVMRAAERRYRLVVEGLPTLVTVRTPAGDLEFANRHVLEYTGATLEELRGLETSGAIHPDDRPLLLAAWKEALDTESPYDIEVRRRRADGVYRWFHNRGFPLRDTDGQILLWYLLGTDIDDQKRAEEALRASEQNLRSIIDTIPTAAWSTRPDGYCDFLSRRWLDYAGFSAEQAQGWGWAAAIHPDDANRLREYWQSCLDSGTPVDTEARIRRFDGVYRWFLFRANPLRDESGNIVKWYGTNVDIEDRKRADEELRRSEAFLAEGQRLNLTGSFLWRVDTDEIAFSEQLYRIHEFEHGAPVTLELIAGRIHPEDVALLSEKIAQARAASSGELSYDIRLRMQDGSVKHLRTVAHVTRNREGRQEIIGAVQDVTERRHAEEALGKLRSELAHMTRVASLGALTASIAHEVNQPLSGIITNASTCLRMLAANPPNVTGALETARRTIRDGNRASEVITRLRALFSNKEATTEPVDLNEATREVIALSLSELQRNRVVLRLELADDLPRVLGDRIQLQQVILNLLLNASDAMSGVDDRTRQLVIKTERYIGDSVRVTLQDTGIGIDPKNMDRLFDPFYTTKSSGMGIGLSVSQFIIQGHHGRLWAAVNDGAGATFAFSIPRAMDGATGAGNLGAIQTSALTDTQNDTRNP